MVQTITILIALQCSIISVYGQSWLYPESIVHYNPLARVERPSDTRFLSEIQFWGEFGQYVIQRDFNHRWDVTVGGTVEMWRGEDWNILFETNVHLGVDPNNNIAFNPRMFTWEEGFLYGLRSGTSLWQFGYQHRCKHDIDNLELMRTTGREESRSLIYGSIMARWDHLPMNVSSWQWRPMLELHAYVLTQDQRFPVATRTVLPSMKAALAAARGRVNMSLPIAESLDIGVTVDARITTFGKDPEKRLSSGLDRFVVEPSAELFLNIRGAAAHMQLFMRYAHQPDDFISPVPRSAGLIAVGVRLLDSR